MTRKTVTLSVEEAKLVANMLRFLRRTFPIPETSALSQKLSQFLDHTRRAKKNESPAKPDRPTTKRPKSIDK